MTRAIVNTLGLMPGFKFTDNTSEEVMMLKNLRETLLPGMLTLATVLTLSCRTTMRPQTETSEPVIVKLRIVGLAETDRSRSDLVYTLTGCGSGNTSGTKDADNMVRFETQGVRKDDRCDIRVLSGKSDIGVANWFAEEGLMYEARRVTIAVSDGTLTGLAVMQRLYAAAPVNGPALWKLNAAVKGPKAFIDLCTCSITCAPQTPNNVAKLDIKADTSTGTCEFVNVTGAQLSNTTCSKLSVQCGQDFYIGAWTTGNTVDGSVAKISKLPDIALVNGVPETTSDTTIEVVVPR